MSEDKNTPKQSPKSDNNSKNEKPQYDWATLMHMGIYIPSDAQIKKTPESK